MDPNMFPLSMSGDNSEASLTLNYLLENPNILQNLNQEGEKCKEAEGDQSALISAYLGPQIWDDILPCDDLKLEPVDLEELLESSGVNDGMTDLKMLMSASPLSMEGSMSDAKGEMSPGFFDDMPQLESEPPLLQPPGNPLNYSSPPRMDPAPRETPPSPIVVNIPSPVDINFTANSTDVLLSTPYEGEIKTESFNPCTRKFTEDELKPQPIVRKSKKNYVASDDKDGNYWKRRNKNNEAAKKSREARRIKENQIAMRANFLEQENIGLKLEVTNLRQELNRVVELVRLYEQR